MSAPRTAYYLGTAIVAVVLVLFGLLAGEITIRLLDGYRPLSLALVRPHSAEWMPAPIASEKAKKYAAVLPLAKGMKLAWFDLSPPSLPRHPSPELNAIAEHYSARNLGFGLFELFHVFNARFARDRICQDPLFKKFPGFMFLYDPFGNDEHPRYRFPLNTVTPDGLVTNQFGWRGPPISLRKPANTIRIAFVGASTTVGVPHSYPFSYPELVGFWLDKWAWKNFGIHVEAINAGREGINSTDIAAVVRQELLPVEPDLIIYYEGANQFNARPLIRLRATSAAAPAAVQAPVSVPLIRYSALMRRVQELAKRLSKSNEEPPKPAYDILWPAGVDEANPPLDSLALPLNLPTILHDLDRIRAGASEHGAELVLSSFFWLVYDGMKLDPVRNRSISDYLNKGWLFPLRYHDIARFAAFQNRVFKKYAAVRGVPFLDIATATPRDPDLFNDAIHAKYEGVRLRAWIFAQQLAPLLRKRIADKRLPRPSQSQLTAHPAFPANERTVLIDCTFGQNPHAKMMDVDLSATLKAEPPARMSTGETYKVHFPAGTRSWRYVARIALPTEGLARDRDYVVTMQLKVSEGEVGAGILSADRKTWRQNALSGQRPAGTIVLPLTQWDMQDGVGPLIIYAGKTSPHDVTVELSRVTIGRDRREKFYAHGLARPPWLRSPRKAQP